MSFTPKTWENPGTALTDLENRVKAAFDALPASKETRQARVAMPALAANTTIDVDAVWSTPFADVAYTVNVNVQENLSAVAYGAIVRQIRAVAADKITVRVSTGTQAFTAGQVTLHASAVHD